MDPECDWVNRRHCASGLCPLFPARPSEGRTLALVVNAGVRGTGTRGIQGQAQEGKVFLDGHGAWLRAPSLRRRESASSKSPGDSGLAVDFLELGVRIPRQLALCAKK